jgi:hypothetical protein
MKKFFIIEHEGKELGNYLLNDMSLYACALNVGAKLYNITFFEHLTFTKPLHFIFARLIDRFTRASRGISALGAPKYLPPTEPLPEKIASKNAIFFFGWLFRNPAGFEKYRAQIIEKFGPSDAQMPRLHAALAPLQGKKLVGLHVRLKPFTGFKDGEFLVPLPRVEKILEEYLQAHNIEKNTVGLAIVSDLPLPSGAFAGFEKIIAEGTTKETLFLLASTSVVLGINTTFSNLAAWFGNMPHIVLKNEALDWLYYRDQEKYFDNKYVTFMHG